MWASLATGNELHTTLFLKQKSPQRNHYCLLVLGHKPWARTRALFQSPVLESWPVLPLSKLLSVVADAEEQQCQSEGTAVCAIWLVRFPSDTVKDAAPLPLLSSQSSQLLNGGRNAILPFMAGSSGLGVKGGGICA